MRISRGNCSTRLIHSSARPFQTLRRGASSTESLGSRPPRSGYWANRLASTNFKNQPRSIWRARRRLSSCWRWSTSVGGKEAGSWSGLPASLTLGALPRPSSSQPKAVPTTADSTRANTTGQSRPSAAASLSSWRARPLRGGGAVSRPMAWDLTWAWAMARAAAAARAWGLRESALAGGPWSIGSGKATGGSPS